MMIIVVIVMMILVMIVMVVVAMLVIVLGARRVRVSPGAEPAARQKGRGGEDAREPREPQGEPWGRGHRLLGEQAEGRSWIPRDRGGLRRRAGQEGGGAVAITRTERRGTKERRPYASKSVSGARAGPFRMGS